jgi:hypothetical protein
MLMNPAINNSENGSGRAGALRFLRRHGATSLRCAAKTHHAYGGIHALSHAPTR